MADPTVAAPAVSERTSVWIAMKGILRTLGISVPTVWESLRRRIDKTVIDERLQGWAKALLQDAEITLQIEGREHLRSGAIYMSNHLSLYDVPCLTTAIPDVRMVTKQELFKVPIWGPALRAGGFIAIDRRDRDRAIASLQEAAEKMRSGVNVWIAPEGTRSRDGQLGGFKKGGFVMAIETGATIVPVTIEGTYDILPPKTAAVRLGRHVTLRLHPPIEARDYTLEQRDQLLADVRAAIVGAEVPEARSAISS